MKCLSGYNKTPLPITHVLPEVREALLHHHHLVVQAPPGAGKTTALPLALLDAPWRAGRKILLLEPRRLAVRASAARMAQMLGEKVGQRIGYRIKMDTQESDQTEILVVTEGILTRMLQYDPALEDVAIIVFDEFHERSLHADLSLALALESQAILRPDLKLLIMSATLNASAMATLLGGAPIVRSEGRSFAVERIYLDPATPQPRPRELAGHIVALIQRVLREERESILVFLSGIRQIKATQRLLRPLLPADVHLSVLYGNLSKAEQDRAIQPSPKGSRKIVLATNIAQTSLTIEGITVVIDSGHHRVALYDPITGMSKLQSRFISEDAATQRAGRAGRVQAGRVYHLWHRSRILLKHDTPEILTADLAPLVLELARWGTSDPETLTWLDPPPAVAIDHARALLIRLGALDGAGRITPHGEAMSRYGLHPRLAHMMLRAEAMGLAYEASLLAVLITEKDIYRQQHSASVDLRERVRTLHEVAQGEWVDPARIDPARVDLKQCRYLLANAKRIAKFTSPSLDTELLGVLLAYAYPDRIAQRRRPDSTTFLLGNGKGALLHSGEMFREARYLVVSDLDARKAHATIFKALPLTLEQIEEHLETCVQERVSWNAMQGRVEVRRVILLGRLTLRETHLATTDHPEVTKVLLNALKTMGLEEMGWSREAIVLRDRIAFARAYDGAFPDVSDAYLQAHLHEWLEPYLAGIATLREVKALDMHAILRGLLSYEQAQRLDALAPAKLRVASGSHIAIDYTNPHQPILAVRLQEMFGTRETPTIMEGRVTLTLHLLSPARRLMQVTQDLGNFWKQTYSEVKKELRGKYKKHYWPDNPLEAQATNRTKRGL
jgi:ATP-dependent helicase HrpB